MCASILLRWLAIGGQKMGSRKLSFLFCASLLIFASEFTLAEAAKTTTEMYYALKNDSLSSPFWTGYVGGIGDADSGFCPPEGTTFGQEGQIVINYLAANPKYWNLPPSTTVMLALEDAFPCKNK